MHQKWWGCLLHPNHKSLIFAEFSAFTRCYCIFAPCNQQTLTFNIHLTGNVKVAFKSEIRRNWMKLFIFCWRRNLKFFAWIYLLANTLLFVRLCSKFIGRFFNFQMEIYRFWVETQTFRRILYLIFA